MKFHRTFVLTAVIALLVGLPLSAQWAISEKVDLDAVYKRWQHPGQHIVARVNSPDGRLLVMESEGQAEFIETGLPLASTRGSPHIAGTVHYAMAQRPEALARSGREQRKGRRRE